MTDKEKLFVPLCSICHVEFDEYYHTPRVVPRCGHTFCEKCIGSALIQRGSRRLYLCHECTAEVVVRRGIADDLPKNLQIISLVKNYRRKSNQTQQVSKQCPIHNKPLDLLCGTCDYRRICANCALFGEHKSHSYCEQMPARQEHHTKMKSAYCKATLVVEDCILPQAPNNVQKKMQQTLVEGIKKAVATTFKSYYAVIEKKEQEMIKECDQLQIDGIDTVEKIVQNYDLVKIRYENREKILTQNTAQQFITMCNEIVNEVQTMKKHSIQSINALINEISKKLNQQTIFKIQQYCVSLKKLVQQDTPSKRQSLKSSVKLPDQSPNKGITRNRPSSKCTTKDYSKEQNREYYNEGLKQSGQQSLQDSRANSKDQQRKKKDNQSSSEKKRPISRDNHMPPIVTIDQTSVILNKFAFNQSYEQELSDRCSPIIESNPCFNSMHSKPPKEEMTSNIFNRNISKIYPSAMNRSKEEKMQIKDVELKYARVAKELSCALTEKWHKVQSKIKEQENSQSLDLTNMQLNDVLLTHMLQYLRKNKLKYQTVKLIKNNITDEGMSILLSYYVEDDTTEILNMTSNQLTNKCLDYVAAFIKRNSTLRIMCLANHKLKPHLKIYKELFQHYSLELSV